MGAKRAEFPALKKPSYSPPLIVLVGVAGLEVSVIEEFVSADAVVIVAARPELVQQWLTGQLSDPVLVRLEPTSTTIRVTQLTIDLQQHRVYWMRLPLALSEREISLLAALAREPGKALSFRNLFEEAWPGQYFGDPSLIKVAVRRLRQKLKDAGVQVQIESARGFGFRLVTA
jgi:DNA-binding response OmpR family regulator